MPKLPLLALLLALPAAAHDDAPAEARYLGNEGVLVSHGETRVLFDPLYTENFGTYHRVPEAMRDALFTGRPPFEGIDAVFVSHYHDDHFDPADILAYLEAQPHVELFAPAQAVEVLREAGAGDTLSARINSVAMAYGDAPVRFERPGLIIDAVYVPHAGWPERTDVQNIAWRVTLDGGPTVLHLGDADTRDVHFAQDAAFWEATATQLALPPYWYFLSTSGRAVLAERLQPAHAVGIHVPTEVPADAAAREPALQDVDLFTEPGEKRQVPHRH